MSDDKTPGRHKRKVATYYRSGEINGAGERVFELRLYTAGHFEASMIVPSTLLEQQLAVLRAQGYKIDRIQL